MVHFNALNNKKILINGAIPKSKGASFKYYIDKYDTDKNIRKNILLEYIKNQLKEIPLGQTNTLELMDTSTGNLNDSSSTIIYFLDRSSYMVYSLDLNNPKLKPLELKLDEPYKYITQCVADKDGSLIIKVSESKEANSYKYYHVYKIGK